MAALLPPGGHPLHSASTEQEPRAAPENRAPRSAWVVSGTDVVGAEQSPPLSLGGEQDGMWWTAKAVTGDSGCGWLGGPTGPPWELQSLEKGRLPDPIRGITGCSVCVCACVCARVHTREREGTFF